MLGSNFNSFNLFCFSCSFLSSSSCSLINSFLSKNSLYTNSLCLTLFCSSNIFSISSCCKLLIKSENFGLKLFFITLNLFKISFFINLTLKLKLPVSVSLWKYNGISLELESMMIISHGHKSPFFTTIISPFWILFPGISSILLSVIFLYFVFSLNKSNLFCPLFSSIISIITEVQIITR